MTTPIQGLAPRELALPGKTLPPSLPLIISCQDSWDPDSCKLETGRKDSQHHGLQLVEDTLELLRSIDKPVAVLSICGPYRSGKSYFLSRLLGRPGAFQLGHSMRACTRGIWMATTILECQEFAIVLLDTEGIDAIGASETTAMSLLTLTTLLSSYLIYNSKKVPQKVDLDKMRCFTQLSTSLLAQRGQSMSTDAMKQFFPRFLWLLRDVTLKMTDKQGQLIPPTEFLHTRILASESGQLTDLGRSLCSLFPSLECHTLPMPTTNPKLSRNIFELQDKLKPAFNMAVDALIHQILQQMQPKKAMDGVTLVNGSVLTALASGYVNAINIPGALPDLEQGWMAVLKLQLKERVDQLAIEYEREMEVSLRGNLPMEERNLMRIHEQILTKKREALKQEIRRLDPLSFTDQNAMVRQLQHAIMGVEGRDEQGTGKGKIGEEEGKRGEREENEGGGGQDNSENSARAEGENKRVLGGALFRFTTQNYTKSKEYCEKIWDEEIKKSEILEVCEDAIIDSKVIDISVQLQQLDSSYNERAIGPAVKEVLDRAHRELNTTLDVLKKIPSEPRDVKVIGCAPDRMKLAWLPPEKNPEAVEYYVVLIRKKGDEWEKAKETKKTRVLITGLSRKVEYEFQVKAINDVIHSIIMSCEGTTPNSKAASAGRATLVGGAIGAISPILPVVCLALLASGKIRARNSTWLAAVGYGAVIIPSIVMFPMIPVHIIVSIGVRLNKVVTSEYKWGDLSPDSDDEN